MCTQLHYFLESQFQEEYAARHAENLEYETKQVCVGDIWGMRLGSLGLPAEPRRCGSPEYDDKQCWVGLICGLLK